MYRTLIYLALALVAMTIGCVPTSSNDDDGDGNGNRGTGGASGMPGGSGNSGNSGSAQTDQQRMAFITEYFCKVTFECPEWSHSGFAMIAGRFADQDACEQGIEEAANLSELSFSQAVAEGRMSYDGTKAPACLTAMAAVVADACNGRIRQEQADEACDQVYVGLVADGGNCLQDDECSAGLECNFETDECYGVCVTDSDSDACAECSSDEYCTFDGCSPRVALMGACEGSGQCVYEAMCVDGVCAVPMSTALNAGDACDSILGNRGAVPCSAGLVCGDFSLDAGQPPQGTCVPPKGMGETCLTALECVPGMACVDADLMAGTAGTCGPLRAAGESCLLAFDCVAGTECGDGVCRQEEACTLP